MSDTKTQEEQARQRQKEYNYMTSGILKDRKMHMLASIHFNHWGNSLFLISAIVTLAQAGLAIVAQAGFKSVTQEEREVLQSNITMSISFLAAFSVFWQSLVKNWNYNGRASLHDSAASALGHLLKTADLKGRQEKAELKVKAKGTTTDADSAKGKESKNTDLLDQLVKQYEQAIESCHSFVPSRIVAAFELLDNQIAVCNRQVDTGANTGDKVRVQWEKVYPTLYKELYATIITQWCWPYFVPNPKTVVKQTIDRYEKKVNTGLLDILLKRNSEIDTKYGAVSESSDTNTNTNALSENNNITIQEKYGVSKI
eukprot:CAMPEP_0201695798 /NCGR_PEP_ID=MMETSP0578-20130828/7648_1 /ASSEMBLY_ACC=CAM_ASM_000663 /TAXON_ID=267565 /ORGANISM="Skeletonema grethea, Strain CCMP 1804" /LENGTH=312 /DNA_ID=CAMNT_0048181703 /DNA_START=43 /DNA_END=978 /DNA_ORIENTATION=+